MSRRPDVWKPADPSGDAILEAQREFAAEGGSVEMLAIYQLLGDPALGLR